MKTVEVASFLMIIVCWQQSVLDCSTRSWFMFGILVNSSVKCYFVETISIITYQCDMLQVFQYVIVVCIIGLKIFAFHCIFLLSVLNYTWIFTATNQYG